MLAVIVSVGAVASVSLVRVIPVGTVHSESVTDAATWLAPLMAIICVVVLPALAALVVPGKTYASLVRITLYASVRSTSVTCPVPIIAIFYFPSSSAHLNTICWSTSSGVTVRVNPPFEILGSVDESSE